MFKNSVLTFQEKNIPENNLDFVRLLYLVN